MQAAAVDIDPSSALVACCEPCLHANPAFRFWRETELARSVVRQDSVSTVERLRLPDRRSRVGSLLHRGGLVVERVLSGEVRRTFGFRFSVRNFLCLFMFTCN